jgi:hypothetical protein
LSSTLFSTLFYCILLNGVLNGLLSGCTPSTQSDLQESSTSNEHIESSTERSIDKPIDNPTDERDSSMTMDPDTIDDFVSSPDLLVGTGSDDFRSIEEGDISTLHRGCQGAQHLWVSLRLPAYQPDEYGLELTLVDQENQLLAPPFTLEGEEWLPYEPEDQDTQGSQIIGLTLVIFDPMGVVGKDALIKTKVFVGDVVLESRGWVEVQWGADAC